MNTNTLKRTALIAFLLVAGNGMVLADEPKTVIGDGKCAQCLLKEKNVCQNAVVTEEYGKRVTYYLTDTDVSKEFHGQLCKKAAKVKATGTVKEVAGKKELTATKIELVTRYESQIRP